VAETVSYTVTLTEQGQMMQRLVLSVRNSAKQYVRVFLPSEGHEIWSAMVAGKPVKPATDGSAIMIPLKKDGGRQDAFVVELVWVESTGAALGARGSADFALPRIDLPVGKLFVSAWLPREYRYGEFTGDLKECARFSSGEPNPSVVTRRMSGGNSSRLAETRRQVDEVLGLMQTNVERCLDRDQHLDSLQDQCESLESNGLQSRGRASAKPQAMRKMESSDSHKERSWSPPAASIMALDGGGQAAGGRGRAGVVPVQIDMVTAGRCFRFERLLLAPEEPALRMAVPYKRKSDAAITQGI
jgi:hypothetical protein